MGRAYSDDLRERVVRAVIKGGLSRHQAAAQFGVGISTAINWVQRFHQTGSVKPDQIGGYRPKKIAGPHREWLIQRCRNDFTVRGLVAELAERGLKVDYRTMWEFVHAEKLSYKKDADCRRAGSPRCRPSAGAVDQVSGSDRSHSAGVHR
jgi:putative transposase